MKRLDIELVKRGLFKTRSKANLAIKAGQVYCDGKLITKSGYAINENANIEIKGEILPYVSRGGLKLAKAIDMWNIDLTNKIMLDIGSSTGGFSDCALQNGIKKVYAIDVGTNQFDKELALNPKVVLMEQTDFRKVKKADINDATFMTIDISFISVTKLMDKISELTNLQEIVCLIKPQFECGKEIADKYRGIILNKEIHQSVIEKIYKEFKKISFKMLEITYSPIRGGDGNIEYLAYFQKEKKHENNLRVKKTEEKYIGDKLPVVENNYTNKNMSKSVNKSSNKNISKSANKSSNKNTDKNTNRKLVAEKDELKSNKLTVTEEEGNVTIKILAVVDEVFSIS